MRGGVVTGEPEEWVEVRIRAEPIRSPRRRHPMSFDVTVRLDKDTRRTVQSLLAPGSDFRRDYRDIRVERRTVRTVATDWEPVSEGEQPAQ